MVDATSETDAVQNKPTIGLLPFEPRVGMVSYHVADIQRSLDFYVGVLGMTERGRFPGVGPDEHELVLSYPGSAGAWVMLMWNSKRSDPYKKGDGYSRFTIVVSDANAAMSYLQQRDVPVLVPVSAANNVLWAVVKDPDGYMIELLQFGGTSSASE